MFKEYLGGQTDATSQPTFMQLKDLYTTRPARTRATSAFLRPDSHRFSIMRSVSRGVKNVNVTEIINMELPPVEPSEYSLLQPDNKTVSTLKYIRRLCNEALSTSTKREKDLQALRSYNERLKEKKKEMDAVTAEIQRLDRQIEDEKEQATTLYEDNFWKKRTYENIRERLIEDKLVLGKRLHNLYQVLNQKRSVLREVESRLEETKVASAQANLLLLKTRHNLVYLEERKGQKLFQYEDSLSQQFNFRKYTEYRKGSLNDIADLAIQEKDTNEKNWRKLLMVHRFLKGMLRDKMRREMEKFAVVEQAYQSIKTKTGVWQAEYIVYKFINRDYTYGNLLYSIAEAEKKITIAKKKNEELRTLDNQLKDTFNELEKPSKKAYYYDLSRYIKTLSQNSRANINAGLIKEKLYRFAIETLQKLDVLSGDEAPTTYIYKYKYSQEELPKLFEHLQNRLFELDAQEIQAELRNDLSGTQPIKNPKNFRVDITYYQPYHIDDQDEVAQIEATRHMLNNTNAWFFYELKKKYDVLRKKQGYKDKQPVKREVQPKKEYNTE